MKTNKENDMICTGGIPPQLVLGMELYQTYLQGVMNYYYLWANVTGLNQWVTYVNKLKNDQ